MNNFIASHAVEKTFSALIDNESSHWLSSRPNSDELMTILSGVEAFLTRSIHMQKIIDHVYFNSKSI